MCSSKTQASDSISLQIASECLRVLSGSHGNGSTNSTTAERVGNRTLKLLQLSSKPAGVPRNVETVKASLQNVGTAHPQSKCGDHKAPS